MCHVFPPLLSIFGLFPVLVQCDYELILVQLCLSHDLWLSCVFIVLSVQFDVLCYILDDELYPRLRVLRSSLVCAPWQKTRPNSKLRPFISFSFVLVFKVFCFVPVCLSRGSPKPGIHGRSTPPSATHPSRHSWEIDAAVRDSPKPASDSGPPARHWFKPAGRRHGSSSLITARSAVPRSRGSSSLIRAALPFPGPVDSVP